ncbi:MAG: multicopper oxidase domain-containing protein [Pseudomonadota bacterium]
MTFNRSRRRFLAQGFALASAPYCLPLLAQHVSPDLPIPDLLDGRSGDPLTLEIRSGQWSFIPGFKTHTMGFNQGFLGPTIRTRKNSELNLHYLNKLNEGVAVHGHGLHVPGSVDGGPHLEIPQGEVWSPSISIVQPAATCWYHSHTHHKSGSQTYRGLAGMMIIDDDDSDAMDLPSRYGIDDLPIIIQDKTFDEQGQLVYSLYDAGHDGWFGETVVINGAINPLARVPAGKVRLRLLNGANARFYIVTFADNRVFHKIASDGGLLKSPVPLTTMEIAPGERCEIIVDMADGKPAEMLTLFEDDVDQDEQGLLSGMLNLFADSESASKPVSLTLRVDPGLASNTAPLPENLADIARPLESEIERTREFLLTMEMNDENESTEEHADQASHAAMDMGINGVSMNMDVINERVEKGVWERWRVKSDMGEHPFHVHGCSFLVETVEGEPAPPRHQGWKDVVVTDDDGWSEFVVRFDHTADEQTPYMYHCHILEHEDRGMMGQFTVA